MAAERGNETQGISPGPRYAERECSDCGVILPANLMVRTDVRFLAGYTKSRRHYGSTRGTYGSGGTTNERYRFKTLDLCPDCTALRQQANRAASRGKLAGYCILGALVVAAIYSFSGKTTENAGPSDTPSMAANAPPEATNVPADAAPAPATDVGMSNPISAHQPEPIGLLNSDAAKQSSTMAGDEAPKTEPSPSQAPAASPSNIDCLTEAACSNPNLRKDDAQIAAIYHTLIARAASDERTQYIEEQTAWNAERQACTSDNCVGASINRRLRAVTAEAWKQYNAQHAAGTGGAR
jgi:uncharacterized protein YecT (DUF1311 family)